MMTLAPGLGIAKRRRSASASSPGVDVAALLSEAVVLNDAAPSYSRSGNQWNPFTSVYAGANVRVRQAITARGVSFQADRMMPALSNLATALATGSYATVSTASHTVWWDGGTADYALTTNGAGAFSAKKQTADGRWYQTLTGHASGDTITCTRAGSPTNTHLQMTAFPCPTDKIALGGSLASATLRTTGRSFDDVGTIVAVARPCGWSNDQGAGTNWTLMRGATGATNSMWVMQSATASELYLARFYTGGSASQNRVADLRDNQWRVISVQWSAAQALAGGQSGWQNHEFTDDGAPPAAGTSAATLPFINDSSLDLGCWIAGGGRQFGGDVLFLHYARLLSQAELTALGQAFESSSARYIATWGDSETGYSSGLTWPSLVYKTYRPGWHLYNDAHGGETSAQILVRLLGQSHLWTGNSVHVWWSNNSFSLADIDQFIARVGLSRSLIISPFNSTANPSGSANYVAMIAFWNSVVAKYPNNTHDLRAALIAQNNNTTDVTDTANDVVGTSMRVDTLHLNTSLGHPRAALSIDGAVVSKLGIAA